MNEGDLVAGRYKLLRPIGGGAMGSVWAARHELLGRDFALKFAHVQAEPSARSRFQREAQIIGKLRHPNIVDVTDFGEASPNGDFYLAMELLEGESLAEHIERHGPLDSYDAVAIAAEVARGLSAVHAVGIIHRDIKPENIFLAKSPTGSIVPKLLDFGISKDQSDAALTQQGALTGTPAYMSPEQAIGETNLDPRTDVWSLGVVLYEMLTGKHPFVAPNYQALMMAIAERPFEPLETSMPEAVRRLVMRCLEKRPADRFSSSEALMHALEDTLAKLEGSRTQRSRIERSRPAAHADKRWLVLTAVLVGILGAAMAIWLRMGTSVPAKTSSSSMVNLGPEPPRGAASGPLVTPVADVAASANVTNVTASPTAQTAPTASQRTKKGTGKRPSTSVNYPGF